MIIAGILTGACGVLCALSCPRNVDSFFGGLTARARYWAKRLLEAPPQPEDDLVLAGRLISALRAGQSLDQALENAARDAAPGTPLRARIHRVLHGETGGDFFTAFLLSSLKSGTPALAALQGIEKALTTKRRLQLRAAAITSQCRAQAEVLSWLPWTLALGIFLLDTSWSMSAARSSLAWALWAIAILLSGLGRRWIQRGLRLALRPKGPEEKIEEEILPDFSLRLLAELSLGRDLETCTENALRSLERPEFSAAFAKSRGAGAFSHQPLARLRSILEHGAQTGAPVRDELLNFLQILQCELESRWEERVQRLPVALLAPLFLCFFPSSLLVLAGLLLPLLRENL